MEMQGVFLLLTASSGAVIEIPGLLAQFSPTLRRIREVLDIPMPGPRPSQLDSLRQSTQPPHVIVAGLSFSYGDAPVLRNVNLELPSGMRVGLVAESGGGKSTLARLLLGDQRPSAGHIFFDGVDITDWHFWWRRELVGYLPAEQGFLTGTLEENILFGRPRESVGDIEVALRASGVADIVDARRERGGLQFRIDGRVEDILSTGQRRKVGIARLLIGDQRLWIFDEPGSGLDPHSMREVAHGLAEITAGRTCLIITHDPDVFVTDFNVFLQNGTVADIGPHHQLLERNRAYAALVSRFAEERAEGGATDTTGVAWDPTAIAEARPASPISLTSDTPQKVRLS
jgi:ATP-binding cassette subfamily B protein